MKIKIGWIVSFIGKEVAFSSPKKVEEYVCKLCKKEGLRITDGEAFLFAIDTLDDISTDSFTCVPTTIITDDKDKVVIRINRIQIR